MSFHVAGQGQDYFKEGSRSLGKVKSYSVVGSQTPSPMASF